MVQEKGPWSRRPISGSKARSALEKAGLLLWARGTADDAKPLEISVSSRSAGKNSIFLMFSGTRADSHDFAERAIEGGCRTLVGDNEAKLTRLMAALTEEIRATLVVLCVSSARAAWAVLEAEAARDPENTAAATPGSLIGVTGTNGKTSTVWLLRGILDAMGQPTVSIGTLGLYFRNTHNATSHTSPDPDFLYPHLAGYKSLGAKVCAMEVSSHSLAQEKVVPLTFDAAVFTSFSRDHLDFHGTEENYFATKMRLFSERMVPGGRRILHASVAHRAMATPGFNHASGHDDTWIYGIDLDQADWPGLSCASARIISSRPEGTRMSLSVFDARTGKHLGLEVELPVFGDVFVENATAAILAAEKITKTWPSPSHLQDILPVPGRMERVALTGQKSKTDLPAVFVDYAHTPDALDKALAIVQQIRPDSMSRIWCVFGCGGDRDRGKRPEMARVAARGADQVIITSDNPRSEDPAAILDEIDAGFAGGPSTNPVIRLADRADAIAVAIRDAGPSDLILVAGKGHEDYQEISGVRHHFDDRAEARSALSVRAGTTSAVVIGGGVSGIAAARLAASRGMKVAISDRTDMDPALKSQLAAAGISCFDGGHSSNHLDGAELVLLSPGVRADHPLLLEAKKRLLPVRSEIDFALQGFSGRLIGVTGTNGKSTTVSMLGHLLGKLAIPVSVGGNIGDPPSDMVMRGELKSNVVLELSSYQLDQSRTLRSDVAIFSSFSHDHLERHGSVQAYFQAKWRLFDGIKPGGLCLMTADVAEVAEKFNLRIPAYSHQIVIPGIRSASTAEINSRLAILAAKHLESRFEEEELLATLADFRGLPYRCERIGQIEGHSVINDSKSTNCESTCAALAGIATGTQIILMMGGKGKGESYRDILASKDKINLLICFGASGQIIADELSSVMKTKVFPGMREAVAFAAKSARSAGCGLLFSPGCASFDEFRNFEHRGQEFNHAVYQWLDSSPDQRNGK